MSRAWHEPKEGESPYTLHHDLQEKMHDLVGIFRTEEDLTAALTEIARLKSRAERLRVDGSRLFNPGWHLARDLKSMLTVVEAVTRSALARKESRGAHSRIDFPKPDAEWGRKNNLVSREQESMKLTQSPIPEMPQELRDIMAEK